MDNNHKKEISPTKLRIGCLLIFLWWIPIWVVAPEIADFFGLNSNNARIVIMIIQTIIGVIGMLVVGKEVASIMRGIPFKKMIPTIWRVLRYGSIA